MARDDDLITQQEALVRRLERRSSPKTLSAARDLLEAFRTARAIRQDLLRTLGARCTPWWTGADPVFRALPEAGIRSYVAAEMAELAGRATEGEREIAAAFLQEVVRQYLTLSASAQGGRCAVSRERERG
ncbi:hypothetical protein [Muricoccus radiodurans]|uniref:hypothetical protein n=1 Tax=Muricoccus radiodurans TaxID=2231721 RepID=UPI003CEF54B9